MISVTSTTPGQSAPPAARRAWLSAATASALGGQPLPHEAAGEHIATFTPASRPSGVRKPPGRGRPPEARNTVDTDGERFARPRRAEGTAANKHAVLLAFGSAQVVASRASRQQCPRASEAHRQRKRTIRSGAGRGHDNKQAILMAGCNAPAVPQSDALSISWTSGVSTAESNQAIPAASQRTRALA